MPGVGDGSHNRACARPATAELATAELAMVDSTSDDTIDGLADPSAPHGHSRARRVVQDIPGSQSFDKSHSKPIVPKPKLDPHAPEPEPTQTEALERGFIGSPSSYARLSWSSTSNRHVKNHQVGVPPGAAGVAWPRAAVVVE